MISFVKGKLIEATALYVVLEAQGIGYKVYIAANAMATLPQVGEPLLLHTSFVIREFSQSLYGFLSGQERDLFEALMNVTGRATSCNAPSSIRTSHGSARSQASARRQPRG
jgi:holliday junction DNA helicase RuvA